MLKISISLKLVKLCVVLLLVLLSLSKNDYASVSRITAETDDGITFTVWTDKTEIDAGREMIIHYRIKNDGNRTIYLVSERQPGIYVEGGLIQIAEPIPLSGNRAMFDYLYTELRPKGSLEKQVVIPASTYKSSQLWDVTIGFLIRT